MKTLQLFAIIAGTVLCQPVERTFSFKHLQTPLEMNEAATVIRSVGEIANLTVQHAEKTLTLNGNLAQAELAEWLIARLDRLSNTPSAALSQVDFRPVGGSDAVVRVLYFKSASTVQERNEMATLIRSLIEIPSLFTSQAGGAMVIRGAVSQADAAQWVFEQLDGKIATPADRYRLAGGGDDSIRLFAMANQGTVEQFYRRATEVRTELRIARLYTYTPLRVIAIRGTEELIGRTAERLAKP